MTILDFQEMKQQGRKISMVAAYDFWSAQLIAESTADCILVGDSVAMIVHGYPTTISATVEMMALHTAAVNRGARGKFIIGDMPFLSVRSGLEPAMRAVDALMKAGANSVKIEGIDGQEEIIRHIVSSGVPVMGHIGLTPQSVHQLGGFRVQGKRPETAARLREQAKRIEDAGCYSVVLECVHADAAAAITESVEIATIGIGAGPETDGQVLVFHDMLDLFRNVDPKFVRRYAKGHKTVLDALNRFDEEVKAGTFPSEKESYRG